MNLANLARSNAVRAGLAAAALQEKPTDFRGAARRLLRLRGMTYEDLHAATGISRSHWQQRLAPAAPFHLSARMLGKFLDAVQATPAERRELHLLGARADGWEV